MKNTLGSALSRSLGPAIGLVLILLAVGFFFLSPDELEPLVSDIDARIAYYRERVGDRGTYPIYARLGLAYIQKAQETGQPQWYAEAEPHLRTSLDYQSNYEALLGLGMVLAARHEFAEARRYAEQAAAALPESLEVQGLLFDIHLALGDTGQAAATVEKMEAIRQRFAVLSRQAALREYRGDLNGAVEAIERACEDAARSSLPAGNRAWCEVRRGALLLAARCDAAAAEQAYRRALVHLPNYYFAREHLAELRAAQDNLAGAVVAYEALLRDVPAPGYRLALADVLELQGQAERAQMLRQEANDEFWRASERNPHEHVAEHAVILAELTSGVADAVAMIEKEWELRSDTLLATALARVYLAAGKRAQAEQAIGDALGTGTRNPSVRLTAAEIHLAGGRQADAQKLLDEAAACPAALTPGDLVLARELRESWPR